MALWLQVKQAVSAHACGECGRGNRDVGLAVGKPGLRVVNRGEPELGRRWQPAVRLSLRGPPLPTCLARYFASRESFDISLGKSLCGNLMQVRRRGAGVLRSVIRRLQSSWFHLICHQQVRRPAARPGSRAIPRRAGRNPVPQGRRKYTPQPPPSLYRPRTSRQIACTCTAALWL